MIDLKKIINVSNKLLLKKCLGVNYEWGIQHDGKSCHKATIDKKIAATAQKCEESVGKETKACDSSGKHHHNSSKNEGEPIDIDDHRSNSSELMLLGSKLGTKLSNATRS